MIILIIVTTLMPGIIVIILIAVTTGADHFDHSHGVATTLSLETTKFKWLVRFLSAGSDHELF